MVSSQPPRAHPQGRHTINSLGNCVLQLPWELDVAAETLAPHGLWRLFDGGSGVAGDLISVVGGVDVEEQAGECIRSESSLQDP